MELKKVGSLLTLTWWLCVQLAGQVGGQEAAFELPVQLVGFPFIIVAVRLTNFVKKLSYSLSPATYRARSRRALPGPAEAPGAVAEGALESLDALEVEKRVVRELGARACVYERVCTRYAIRARARAPAAPHDQLDWDNVFSQYKRSPQQSKEFYLLSVFLGDIVGSPLLCHQLAKRRPCEPLSFHLAATEPTAL